MSTTSHSYPCQLHFTFWLGSIANLLGQYLTFYFRRLHRSPIRDSGIDDPAPRHNVYPPPTENCCPSLLSGFSSVGDEDTGETPQRGLATTTMPRQCPLNSTRSRGSALPVQEGARASSGFRDPEPPLYRSIRTALRDNSLYAREIISAINRLPPHKRALLLSTGAGPVNNDMPSGDEGDEPVDIAGKDGSQSSSKTSLGSSNKQKNANKSSSSSSTSPASYKKSGKRPAQSPGRRRQGGGSDSEDEDNNSAGAPPATKRAKTRKEE